MKKFSTFAFWFATWMGAAGGADDSARYIRAWQAGVAIEPPTIETTEDADEFRARLVGALENELGPRVGFKAALTHPIAQRRFGMERPILGFLLDRMLLENGATVSLRTAAQMLVEADLLVVVREDAFNRAETDEQLAAALSFVIPFIELPDAVWPPDV